MIKAKDINQKISLLVNVVVPYFERISKSWYLLQNSRRLIKPEHKRVGLNVCQTLWLYQQDCSPPNYTKKRPTHNPLKDAQTV